MISTTLTSWALLVWKTLKDAGIDPVIAFERAGLDYHKLGDPQARYKTDKMYVLWDAAVELTGNADIGISTGRNWSPTSFNALGFAWLAGHSLHESLERLVRYARTVNNSLAVKLEKEGAQYRLILASLSGSAHPVSIDAGLAALITMSRQLLGEGFTPVSIELSREYRAPGALEAFAGSSTSYNHDYSAIVFDAVVAEKSLATGNTTLVMANEQVAQDYLAWLDKNDILTKIKTLLVENLPAGEVNEHRIADLLHINIRTLQRRLKNEGYTFSSLLNETRQEIALNYIQNSQLSLTEIAYLLGFSEQANFTRAFKRWFDKSPSHYRSAITTKKAASL